MLRPVGYDGSKFTELVMTYDQESSQAATDTLHLLRTSSQMDDAFIEKDAAKPE